MQITEYNFFSRQQLLKCCTVWRKSCSDCCLFDSAECEQIRCCWLDLLLERFCNFVQRHVHVSWDSRVKSSGKKIEDLSNSKNIRCNKALQSYGSSFFSLKESAQVTRDRHGGRFENVSHIFQAAKQNSRAADRFLTDWLQYSMVDPNAVNRPMAADLTRYNCNRLSVKWPHVTLTTWFSYSVGSRHRNLPAPKPRYSQLLALRLCIVLWF